MIHCDNPEEQIDECIHALTVCVDALDSPDPMIQDIGFLVQNAHYGIKDGVERLRAKHEEQLARLREVGVHGMMANLGHEYPPSSTT